MKKILVIAVLATCLNSGVANEIRGASCPDPEHLPVAFAKYRNYLLRTVIIARMPGMASTQFSCRYASADHERDREQLSAVLSADRIEEDAGHWTHPAPHVAASRENDEDEPLSLNEYSVNIFNPILPPEGRMRKWPDTIFYLHIVKY